MSSDTTAFSMLVNVECNPIGLRYALQHRLLRAFFTIVKLRRWFRKWRQKVR